MTYEVPFGSRHPGFILILIDQSGSMEDEYGNMKKKNIAASAVNNVINEILEACQSGIQIKDRCYVGVIGYGKRVDSLLGGKISKVSEKILRTEKVNKKVKDASGKLVDIEQEIPIWIEPKAENGTPMHDAFNVAYEVIENWIGANHSSFPPVVINITDGDSNYTELTRLAALKVMDLKTSDGNTLIWNAHISSYNAGEKILPNSDSGLPDEFARFLYGISSVVPDKLLQAAIDVGFAPQQGARGFVFNAAPETMIKLLSFGTIGTINSLR
jgi:hypothetical protein